jgi:hypothetical protein
VPIDEVTFLPNKTHRLALEEEKGKGYHIENDGKR